MYLAQRRAGEALPSGSAPAVSATPFKSRRGTNGGAIVKDWEHHLSREGKLRTTSTLKSASQVQNPASMISLGTARPSARFYPWRTVLMEGTNSKSRNFNKFSTIKMSCEKGEDAYNLDYVLNYSYAAGSPQVLRFIVEHIEMIHRPSYSDWEGALTCGNTSALDICLRLLCDHGDTILADEFTYPGTLEAAKALGLKVMGIGMDEAGLVPDDLEYKLSHWHNACGSKPKILYIIPTGQNPTGITQPAKRRAEIYEVAERHDLIVIEDDPYYFIQLRDMDTSAKNPGDAQRRYIGDSTSPVIAEIERYLATLPPSYLSLDRSGRVIRLDTTSKILAPGLRCGWITACSQLIQKFLNHTEMTTVAPSGPSQMMLYKLLDESWGHEGYLAWLNHLSQEYTRCLQTLLMACKHYLPDICRWAVPSAGMFLWIEFDAVQYLAHQDMCGNCEQSLEVLKIEDMIYNRARNNGVFVSKGSWFSTDVQKYEKIRFRLTFAAAAEDELEQAVKRFAEALTGN